MAGKVIKVFMSAYCKPCHEVVDLLKKGRFEADVGEDAAVEFIDVTSEEGFPEMVAEEVTRLPLAKHAGRECKLGIDDEAGIVVITCGDAGEGSPPPPAPDMGKAAPGA